MEENRRETETQKEKITSVNIFSSRAYNEKASATLKKIQELEEKKRIEATKAKQIEIENTQQNFLQHAKMMHEKMNASTNLKNAQQNENKQTKQNTNSFLNLNSTTKSTFNLDNANLLSNQSNNQNFAQEQLKEVQPNVLSQSESICDISNILKENPTNKNPIKPQKDYSFRMKLMCGVLVMLVVLFGGLIVNNAIELNAVNNNIAQIEAQNSSYETSIAELVDSINKLNNGDENNESLEVSIISNVIEITPPALDAPTEITPKSNWFDAFCNWLERVFS